MNPDSSNSEHLPSAAPVTPSAASLARCSTREARNLLPLEKARLYQALPLGRYRSNERAVLTVALADSSSSELVQALRFIASHEIEPVTVPEKTLRKAIERAYAAEARDPGMVLSRAEAELSKVHSLSTVENDVRELEGAVPEFLNMLLETAYRSDTSDIHLLPQRDKTRCLFRQNGQLTEQQAFSSSRALTDAVIRRVKTLCRLDPTKIREPGEGSFQFPIGPLTLAIRVSTIPSQYGEKAVFRLHDKLSEEGELKSLSELGLSFQQEQQLNALLASNSGALLLAGPTGSGKSTLLYRALQHLQSAGKHILSLEDPIEQSIDGITQVEVPTGASFAPYLKAALRQDPDVIMLGEIRDADTAVTALTAGITGHLVLGTIHAGDSFEALIRLSELGVRPALLGLSLRMIAAGRLVRVNCEACKKKINIPPPLLQMLRIEHALTVFESAGCEECGDSATAGRTGVFEVLNVDSSMKRILLEKSASEGLLHSALEDLYQRARAGGFSPWRAHLKEKFLQGQIAPLEMLRTLGISAQILETSPGANDEQKPKEKAQFLSVPRGKSMTPI